MGARCLVYTDRKGALYQYAVRTLPDIELPQTGAGRAGGRSAFPLGQPLQHRDAHRKPPPLRRGKGFLGTDPRTGRKWLGRRCSRGEGVEDCKKIRKGSAKSEPFCL